jgi:hypothetical protein
MPLIGFNPPEREGAPPPPTTHYEVLLPSGRAGWVPVTAVRPFDTEVIGPPHSPTGLFPRAAGHRIVCPNSSSHRYETRPPNRQARWQPPADATAYAHKSQSDVANALGLHFSSFKSTRMGRAALARAGCRACAQFYKSR